MAKVQVAGKAVVITSSLKLEEINLIKKYKPETLILRGGEDGKEPIFAISAAKEGEVGKFGISFADVTRDEHKFATVTLITEYVGDDIKEFVADELGVILNNLTELEKILPAVVTQIKTDKAALLEKITVLQ